MKKALILSIILFCFALGSRAQVTDGYFDHLSAGLTAGTSGVGIELAAPIGPSFQLRAGYSLMPPFSYSRTFNVPEHPGATGSAKGADVPVDTKATLNLSDAELLVDFFPARHDWFHITAGLMYGSKKALKVANTSPLPSDYNTVGLDVDGNTVKAIDNYIHGYIGTNSFRPYIGVGYGRAVPSEKRVAFTADLGVIYWGKVGLYAPGEPLIGDWQDVRVTPESLNGRDEGLLDKAEKIVVYPMLNLHLFVKLF